MDRQHVISSNLTSVGYDACTRILEVEFHHGGVYHYGGIPAAVHQALMAASSKGTYFDRQIRFLYPYIRIW